EKNHPTAPGVTAAALRAEHELLVSETLRSGAVDELTPAEFAAITTALVGEELRPASWVKAEPVGNAVKALQQMVRLARQVRIAQYARKVDIKTRIHAETAGLTQLWAEEADWDYLMGLTNLDEGDVVRVFRRTVDLLEQIHHAPMLDPAIRALARDAKAAMDREPVREVL
ncbi:MAG TPA: RNA helicase, partial [Armatimonadota bacterium]|nr:RNA helicase [Armatimonadota bacterium]